MRTLLFFDTETTGLPKNYRAPSSDIENWPHLVELGYVLVKFDGSTCKIAQSESMLIEPSGWVIPEETSKIHGITTKMCEDEGHNLYEVLEKFMNLQYESDFLVAHNSSFDGKILRSAVAKVLAPEFEQITKAPTICTMKESTEWCSLPGKRGPKWPKLEEFYDKCFLGETFEAHRADQDCLATVKCFEKMFALGIWDEGIFDRAIASKEKIDKAVIAKKLRGQL